ncbi:MAG: hypothetical protein N2112_13440 [Gemmataceae bacterium]|jgi:hypothetical protein|nr:hypothetical protein [Gemmataceae bacterium]
MKRLWNSTGWLCLTFGLVSALPVTAAPLKKQAGLDDSEKITLEVVGGFQESKEKARRDAIQVAQEQIKEHLLTMDKPLNRTPSFELINEQMVKNIKYDEQDLGSVSKEKFYRATIQIEVNSHHLKLLRGRERSSDMVLVVLGSTLILGIAALFFKFDSYTGGHITRWLIPTMVGVALVVGGLWWWGVIY